MILEVKSWQEECELRALRFADETMKAFQDGLESCVPRLPKQVVKNEQTGQEFSRRDPADRDVLLQIFIDSLVGVTAMVAASYCNDLSSQFEDKVVHEFRRKFFEMRKRTMGAKVEMAMVKIADEETKH